MSLATDAAESLIYRSITSSSGHLPQDIRSNSINILSQAGATKNDTTRSEKIGPVFSLAIKEKHLSSMLTHGRFSVDFFMFTKFAMFK